MSADTKQDDLVLMPDGYEEPIAKSEIIASRREYMEDFDPQLAETLIKNVENGEQLYSILRGMSIRLLTGHMTDKEAFGTGHFDGNTNVALSTIITTEDGLNALVTVPSELVPVMIKHTHRRFINPTQLDIFKKLYPGQIKFSREKQKWYLKAGLYWATKEEAIQEMARENLPIKRIKDKWFFIYPEITIEDDIQFIMTKFAYSIARASGSFQGETKQAGLVALGSISSVPNFQQMAPGFMKPDPEKMNNKGETAPTTSFENKNWTQK